MAGAILLVAALCGCRADGLAGWQSPRAATPNVSTRNVYYSAAPSRFVDVTLSSQAALAEAEELDRAGSDRAVDLYYQAALQAAQALTFNAGAAGIGRTSAWETYHRGLAGLIDAGQRYGRLDPRRQLIVVDGGTRSVAISYFGFAWQPQDFSQLAPAAAFESRELASRYFTPGFGTPLVGVRIAASENERFFRPWQPFAVTAVLRPLIDPAGTVSSGGGAVLELYNPHVFDRINWGASSLGLSRDLTAPLAAYVRESPRQYFRGFTAPTDTAVKPKLVTAEPYQRGKIPLVFIHGLYSDAITWADTANELRAQSDIYEQYQLWTFRYPTGGELLDSAAALRQELRAARESFDPEHRDPALDAMVLVGHSLGGLVSKMQITTSYDILWRQVAMQPFDALRAPPDGQLRLSRDFFYEPVSSVTRVVFIGTPHRGSSMTRRLAGRISSKLVSFGSQEDDQYRELMDDNRDVFRPELARKRPTTIDMLEPTSPFLAALQQMPLACSVHTHSIIGTGGSPLGGPGDGVVSVESARQAGVESEFYVPAKHEKLHRHPDSIAELLRILRLHAAASYRPPVVATGL